MSSLSAKRQQLGLQKQSGFVIDQAAFLFVSAGNF
jgi:hypothetical protein